MSVRPAVPLRRTSRTGRTNKRCPMCPSDVSDPLTASKERISSLAHPSAAAEKCRSVSAVGFCPLEAMFSLGFLALSKIGYQVIGRCNTIDAIDKSDWPALPCPMHVLAAQ
jgi:hypothetical protein